MADDNRYVVDANVFIHGSFQQLSSAFPDMVTVPAVTAELESTEAGRRFDVEDVIVMQPSDEAVSQVEDTVTDLGEDISDTDIALVALALEQEAVLVTDDRGMQNVSASLDVTYTGFLQDEIEEQIWWTYRCAACEHELDPADTSGDTCPSCGGVLKRVPSERKPV